MKDKFTIAVRKFDPFQAAIEKIWARFVEETGCALELDAQPLDLNPLYESLFVQKGLQNGTWDVAFIVTDWLAEAVESGSVENLTPWMQSNPVVDYPDGWVPSLIEFQHWGDDVFALPFHDGPECLVYRKDLFENSAEKGNFHAQFGYPLAPPKTWQQYHDVARFFTRPDDGLYGTVVGAFPDGHNGVYDFCLQLWGRGGDFVNVDGTVQLDTPEAAAALDFYRQLVRDASATYPNPIEVDSVKAGEVFAAGEAAMMINWFGFAAVCEQPDCPVKGKVGLAKVPSAENHPSASLSVYWTLAVGVGSQHKAVAYEFVRFAISAEMDKLTTLEGGIGCRLSTWRDPEINAAIPFYHRLAELTPSARTLPRSRHFPKVAHVIDQMVQRAITSDDATVDILAAAQGEVAGIIL